MREWIANVVQASPEILVFLALGAGYLLAKVKVKGFSLGSTASVLLVAMVIGQIPIDVPPLLKDISFALFAFCIGYQVGPQFFGSLRKEGLNYLWIALVIALSGLATAVILGKVFHFDKGTTAGLFAGSMTQSAVIGTASGAVASLSMAEANKTVLNNNIAVAYAITYLFGTIGVILLFKLIPRFLKMDLKTEARKLEESMGGVSEETKTPGFFSWSRAVSLRAYEVTKEGAFGKSAAELEELFRPWRAAVEKVKRGDKFVDIASGAPVQAGDIVVLAGRRQGLLPAAEIIGPEVDVGEVVEMLGEVVDVCVLRPAVVGKKLRGIGTTMTGESHGVFLLKITRQGRDLPLAVDTVINKCDIVKIVGVRSDIERAVRLLGYADRATSATDLVMVGGGCVLGTLLGLLALPIAGVPLTLGVGGGVLVSGLVFGWLRSVHPTFGQIPEGAQWILTDLGLNLFIACVGLGSARAAVAALQTNGLSVFLAGVVLALIPIIVGVIFGRRVLKMNPVLLLGALTGARVIPPALNALEEDAGSTVLTLGFAAPFAFANVFLTVMGSIIVNIM